MARLGLVFRFGPLRMYVPVARGRYWTHRGCTVRHRSKATADRCKIGR